MLKKTEMHRVRVTVGGDVIDYPGTASTDTDSVTTTAILLNSVISTLDAILMIIALS